MSVSGLASTRTGADPVRVPERQFRLGSANAQRPTL